MTMTRLGGIGLGWVGIRGMVGKVKCMRDFLCSVFCISRVNEVGCIVLCMTTVILFWYIYGFDRREEEQ